MQIGQLGASWGSSRPAISCGESAWAVLKCVEDIAVATVVQIVRYPPYVDCPGHADYAHMNGWGSRAASVAAPVPAVAEDGKSADGDGDAFRHVEIDVPERRQNRHRGPALIDAGVTQIEVEISEGTGGQGPSAQPEPTASRIIRGFKIDSDVSAGLTVEDVSVTEAATTRPVRIWAP